MTVSDILSQFPGIPAQLAVLLRSAPNSMVIAGGMDGVWCGVMCADGALVLTLLYKAVGSIDATQFHALCDGHRNVFVLIVARDLTSNAMLVVVWMDGT